MVTCFSNLCFLLPLSGVPGRSKMDQLHPYKPAYKPARPARQNSRAHRAGSGGARFCENSSLLTVRTLQAWHGGLPPGDMQSSAIASPMANSALKRFQHPRVVCSLALHGADTRWKRSLRAGAAAVNRPCLASSDCSCAPATAGAAEVTSLRFHRRYESQRLHRPAPVDGRSQWPERSHRHADTTGRAALPIER